MNQRLQSSVARAARWISIAPALVALVLTLLLSSRAARAQGAYLQTNLVSNGVVPAQTVDPNLVNPWGLVQTSSSPLWVSDNGTNVATIYTGSGTKMNLTVSTPILDPLTSGPTGIVFNAGTGFPSPSTSTNKSVFIFGNEDGTIDSWAFANGTTAQRAVTVPNASFTGLAINTSSTDIYAANFVTGGGINEFSSNWSKVTPASGAFMDSALASGVAPYNVEDINGTLFVTYALPPVNGVEQRGPGDGALAEFDESGNLLKTLIQGGNLDEPWGVAIAPSDFGAFSNDLLVGNRGNGVINAFDPATGAFLGTLDDSSGNAITDSGLWALFFGTGGAGTSKSALYITAGLDNDQGGVLAAITPTPEPAGLVLLGSGFLLIGLMIRRRALLS